MYGGTMRVVDLEGDSASIGHTHGDLLSHDVSAYLTDRLALAGDPDWSGRVVPPEVILDLTEETLPAHEAYSPELYEEMVSMAGSAGITPAEAVVVGGFTDLIDVVRARGGPSIEEDDCTGIIDADRGVIAQTWDMHASAGEFVYLLRIKPEAGPAALVQTTAGCLGQIGMNEAGIAVGINNLTSFGQVGVTWPFVVRRVLGCESLDDAIKCVLDATLAGGHNFFLMGPDGRGCNIEAMPNHQTVTRVEHGSFAHTNHCLDTTNRLAEADRNPIGQESSMSRLDRMGNFGPDLEQMFSDSVINRSGSGHDVATCGAVIMRPMERTFEGVWGQPGVYPWETFGFD